MRLLSDVHVGVAVDTERGLLVPVIRDADRLGLAGISRSLSDLTARARSGSLLPAEQEQGVFTISNLGAFGIDAFDAVLNPPQAAILAVGRIKERALVEDGRVVPAAMLTLSLSVDHRVLDGARGARFLGDLAELLETPALSME
jgi:pyruvate dehydrogenase E2 component (dihydrolipoamide acetyltransferase)